MPTLHLYVSGRVQGVFYRQTTREKASQLGLSGWVRNLPDGRVEIEASGTQEQLQSLLDWAHDGPPHATVSEVLHTWSSETKHQGSFRVM
ncbi:MAG TPA: acylphosphatase [Planktothrix sp.]|jgi:acylphosphatase